MQGLLPLVAKTMGYDAYDSYLLTLWQLFYSAKETRIQASKVDDICVAVFADKDLCRPGNEISRPSSLVSHHCEIRNSQANSSAGK